MKAVILAGGLGRRMGRHAGPAPKPMLPLGGRPILEHLVGWARGAGMRDIVICVSHRREAIEGHFGDGSGHGVRIEYAATPRPMETAGQLYSARALLGSTFVCMYGDSVFGHSLRAMVARHAQTRSVLTIATRAHEVRLPYGVITSTRAGRVRSWEEKPAVSAAINIGCYVAEPRLLSLIPPRRASGMDEAARRAISRGMRVTEYRTRGRFVDVGDAASYEAALRAHGGGRAR